MNNFLSAQGILGIIFFLYVIIISIKLLLENRTTQSYLAWLSVLIFFPFIGVFFYILFGIDWKKSKSKISKYRSEELARVYFAETIKKQERAIALPMHKHEGPANIAKMCLKSNASVCAMKNNIKVYFNGRDLFEDLFAEIEKAKYHIHIEYFIIKSDRLGNKLKNILIRKAKEGVKVRIIADGLGCFMKIKHGYVRELRKHGVLFLYFHDPFAILWTRYINYRNHRKIVIIDGNIGFTGGMNIGQEYIDGGKRFDTWRDTHLKIEGESVLFLQDVFLCDWYNVGGRDITNFPDVIKDEEFKPDLMKYKKLPTQIVSSGPDSAWNAIQMTYCAMIKEARKYIYIQSPYFVPDEATMHELISASLIGIDVKLMITGIPDKKIAWWAAFTYFDKLIEAGVNIYLYKKGFLHAKMMVMDDMVTSIGTCNMDIRSLLLHYEVNTVIYDKGISVKSRKQFMEDIKNCQEMTMKYLEKRNILERLRDSAARLVSPLL